ncbi:MAG: shikimate kinase [Candidatus Cryptobacteroides sp.]
MAIISLTGFMGCGKSSVGRILASRLGYPFHDLDTIIEKSSGRTIPEIFASDGEEAFRRMELNALREFVGGLVNWQEDFAGKLENESDTGISAVLSLGGGTLTTAECASIVRQRTTCIYLKASADTLVRNLSGQAAGRPMLNGAKDEKALRVRIQELMAKRSEIYTTAAAHVVEVDGLSPEAVADAIIGMLFS